MKILVPTDFSGNAWQTLKYVIELMYNKDCAFTLIHTYEIPNSSSGEIISINDHLRAEANYKLKELKLRAENESSNNNHSFSYTALHGDFLRVINRFLQEEDVDLLAISMSNKCYPDSLPHKGYAKKIIENSKCPVIVVPDCLQNSEMSVKKKTA